ncbi:MAG: thioredoxin family protein [Terracidiphilus sp.]|jgi:thiol:disulfide interchange protein DsbD
MRLIFAFTLALTASLQAWAASSSADAPHVHVQLVFRNAQLTPGGGDHGGLYFKLEPGWHVYWSNPGDAGLPPHIHWTLPEGVTAGPLQFTAPKRLPLGPLMDYGYEDEVLYPFRLELAKSVTPGTVVLHAKVDWLVCRASCIPGKADLEITQRIVAAPPATERDDGPGVEIWKRLARLLPDALPPGDRAFFQATEDGFRLIAETGRRESSAVFFPEDPDILDNPAPQKLTETAKGLTLDFKKDANLTANPKELKGVLELSGGRAYEIDALPRGVAAANGVAANQSAEEATSGVEAPAYQAPATSASASAPSVSKPALFPLGAGIPEQAHRTTLLKLLRISGLAFLGGLLLNLMPCVFPVLFLKGLSLVNSGGEERSRLRAHGLFYVAGILVSFWVLVGVLLGLRAGGGTLGWGFQFQSPVFLTLMAGLLFFLGLSLAGQFEIGLTLTSAGGSLAARQGYTGSFFTGVLAVVVATPCTAPFMGAAIGYALSQSPSVTFAIFTALALGLAAPYLALTLQPAWTRLLPKPGAWMEVLRQAVAVPIFATVIWMAWVVAQAYGASMLAALLASFLLLAIAGWFLGRWPAQRWSATVAGLIVLMVIAVSVFASRNLVIASETLSPPETQGQWEPWSAELVSRYRAQGRPVLVDFTASWCLSCQVNERVALSQPEVKQAFQAANVALLRADWTRRDETITQALTALGRSGVPAYALYAPGQSQPQILPEVLTPGIVTGAVAKLPNVAH